MKYNAIIVGGGPSGSSSAYFLSRKFDVLLLEKKHLPREKLCGGGISDKVLNIIGELPSNIIKNRYFIFYIYIDGQKYKINFNRQIGVGVDRSDFDYYLVRRAEKKGAEIMDDTRVLKVRKNKSIYEVYTNKGVFKSNIVIAADGFPSTIKQSMGINDFNKYEKGIAIEKTIYTNYDVSYLQPEFYFNNISFGYKWMFPKDDHISVGIGGSFNDYTLLKKDFKKFLYYISRRFGISNIKGSFKSHFIPDGSKNHVFKRGNVYFVGDAAGLVNMITGEGIYYSMLSGYYAAKDILNNNSVYSKFIKHFRSKNKMYKNIRKVLGILRIL